MLASGLAAGCAAKSDADVAGSADSGADQVQDLGETDDGCSIGVQVGQCAPDFQLVNAAGESVSLSDHVGAPALIVGTAAW